MTASVRACSLCREIPRLIRESSPYSMPECVRHLGPFNQSGRRLCPECGTGYQVSYEETFEDMSHWEEIEVGRDVSALARPELLQHSEPYIRQDAAFALAMAGHPELGWSHPDPLVRRSAVSALQAPADYRFLLKDEDGPTRQRAARLTVEWLLEHEDTAGLAGLLRDHKLDVRQIAIAYLRHSHGLRAAELAPLLRRWSSYQELAGLEWLALQGYQPERQLEFLLEASRQADPEIRLAAVRSLDGLRALWTPEVLTRLLELLKSDPRCRYALLLSLQKLGREQDLSSFVPVLAEFLATENFGFFQNVASLLARRIELGEGDPSLVCTLMPGLSFGNQHQRRLVGDCYESLLKAGAELGPAQDRLVATMSADKTDYMEDSLVPLMTVYLVRHGCWGDLERLLRGGSSVAGHVALVLSRQELDYSPLKAVLNDLLEHKSSWVSENCLKALTR
ncbi:MAG: HEAT repeat domain-containing protein [Vulcanimicrobiota bacterium]